MVAPPDYRQARGPLPTAWRAVMRWHHRAKHEQAAMRVFSSMYLGRKCFPDCEHLQGKWHPHCSNPTVNRAAGCEATVVAANQKAGAQLCNPRGDTMKATQLLYAEGQSLWLDNITRDLLDSGTLKQFIDELSITGLTSNPTIFDHAIKNSATYDSAIAKKIRKG